MAAAAIPTNTIILYPMYTFSNNLIYTDAIPFCLVHFFSVSHAITFISYRKLWYWSEWTGQMKVFFQNNTVRIKHIEKTICYSRGNCCCTPLLRLSIFSLSWISTTRNNYQTIGSDSFLTIWKNQKNNWLPFFWWIATLHDITSISFPFTCVWFTVSNNTNNKNPSQTHKQAFHKRNHCQITTMHVVCYACLPKEYERKTLQCDWFVEC